MTIADCTFSCLHVCVNVCVRVCVCVCMCVVRVRVCVSACACMFLSSYVYVFSESTELCLICDNKRHA